MRTFYQTFDFKGSVREKLPNGYLLVKKSNLTKAQVSPYLGKEVDHDGKLGWDAEKVYKLFRSGDELKKATPLYNGLPLLMGHHDTAPDDMPKERIVGALGMDASFDGQFVTDSLIVWDQEAIDAIESGEIDELSAGYKHDLELASGLSDGGEAYDAIMKNIKPDHMALVPKGRAGREVRVADGDKPGHSGHGNQYAGGIATGRVPGGAAQIPAVPQEPQGGKPPSRKNTPPQEEISEGDIAQRKGVSPKAGEKEYGSVPFADPVNKKYPLDTVKHVRAALSYWGMPKNRAMYSKPDQAGIGGRIHAAAKRLGISTSTGDSAGHNKERIMGKTMSLSPLAYKVAGAVGAVLHTHKLAHDSATVLALVDTVTPKKFARQSSAIAGSIKAHYGLTDEATSALRTALDAMAEECDEEGEEEEGGAEDMPPAEKPAKPEIPEEKPEEAEDAAKKERDAKIKKLEDELAALKGPDKAASADKKSMDSAIAAAVQAVQKAQKDLREAEDTVAPLVGDVRGLDTAAAVYRYALDQAGVTHDTVPDAALKPLVAALVSTKNSVRVEDAAPVGAVRRFDFSRLGIQG